MKSGVKKKSSKGRKNVLSFSLTEKPNYLYYQLVCIVLFVFTAVIFTVFFNYDFLKWAEEISLFIPTKLFFLQYMKTAGGLLSYVGTFLTQFYHYPFLGITIFILLLLLIQFLTIKAFTIPKQYFPLTFIPSVLLL